MDTLRLIAVACALAACALPPAGSGPVPVAGRDPARDPMPPDPAERACLDSIPDRLLRQHTLVLQPFLRDSGADGFGPLAADLASRVAQQARVLLGGGPTVLPAGEPAVNWRGAMALPIAEPGYDWRGSGYVALDGIVYRDGRVGWPAARDDSQLDSTARALLHRAVGVLTPPVVRAAWPAADARQSVRVRLVLEPREVWTRVPRAGPAFAVFTLREPELQRPQMIHVQYFAYPDAYRYAGIPRVQVVMEYILGRDGMAEASSVRMIEPVGAEGANSFYAAFAQAAAAAIRGASFRPGKIGDCAVRTRVRTAANFLIVRPGGRGPPQ